MVQRDGGSFRVITVMPVVAADHDAQIHFGFERPAGL